MGELLSFDPTCPRHCTPLLISHGPHLAETPSEGVCGDLEVRSRICPATVCVGVFGLSTICDRMSVSVATKHLSAIGLSFGHIRGTVGTEGSESHLSPVGSEWSRAMALLFPSMSKSSPLLRRHYSARVGFKQAWSDVETGSWKGGQRREEWEFGQKKACLSTPMPDSFPPLAVGVMSGAHRPLLMIYAVTRCR
ncbi:unnamed protein product [Pleuronectes platessa]|uniref:Uncharacterized protein n=1 Tax=Pleuronectes platessa TaxID=8262 RepID=A0A9N7YIF9_PLEPL|nr:unnamed protein product [Pleuronectes platessa]